MKLFSTLILIVSAFVAECQTILNENSSDVNGDLIYHIGAIPTSDNGSLVYSNTTAGISGDKSQPNYGSLDIWIQKFDTNNNLDWELSIGGSATDQAFSVVELDNGQYYLIASSSSPVSGNKTVGTNGGSDFYIVGISDTGSIISEMNYGGTNNDEPTSVVLQDQYMYILGQSNSDISMDKSENSFGAQDLWLIKTDLNGNIIWDKTIGGSDQDRSNRIIYNQTNSSLILTSRSGSGLNGNKTVNSFGQDDIWILELDTAGVILQQMALGGTSSEVPYDLIKDSNDNFYIISSSSSPISGNKTELNYGSDDYWIIKMNSDLNVIWERTYGGDMPDSPYSIEVFNNSLLISGGINSDQNGTINSPSKGSTDIYIIVISQTNGVLEFEQRLGGDLYDSPLLVTKKQDGLLKILASSQTGVNGDKGIPLSAPGAIDLWLFDVTTSANLDEELTNELKLYPNPLQAGQLLSFDSFDFEKVEFFGIDGVYNSQLTKNQSQINTTNLDAGTYILRFKLVGGSTISHKIIVL